MNGEIPNLSKKTDDPDFSIKGADFDTIWQRRQRRQTHLLRIYLWVVLMISLAWLVGYTRCSYSWLMGIFVVTLTIWRTKIFRITEEHLMHEQLLVHRKRAMRGSETVEWLNFIVNRWCMFSSTSLSDVLKRRIDPLLKRFKPSLLDDVCIKSLTFGDQAPHIHHVQVFETSDGMPGGRKQASWLNVGKPPKELMKLDKYHVVLDMEAGLHCEQFKMVLGTRIAGMPAGPDILVENLKVEGRIHATITFSTDVVFPHMSKISLSFDEKPNMWFSVKILRSLQLMEIPLLKSWIHNLVLDVVCLSFVDPYKFEIDLTKVTPSVGPILKAPCLPAVGVVSVFVNADGYEPDDTSTYSADDVSFCTLKLGEQMVKTEERKLGQSMTHGCSFLINNLQHERLTLDVENKQMLSSVSVATYDLILANYSLKHGKSIDAVLDKEETSLRTPLHLHLEYTDLPTIQLTQSPPVASNIIEKNTMCGVLYICVHSGYNLLAMDDNGFSDPYCVIFANRKKIKSTHHVRKTLNPRWESFTEIVVDDFTKTNLQFLVYDWDGYHANEDDFLGAAHLTLKSDEHFVVHKALSLGYNILNVGQVSDVDLGSIVVSIVFRPVPAVNEMNAESISERQDNNSAAINLTDESRDKQNSATKSNTGTDVFKLLSQGHGILELNIICARDLVAMDSNGFSDPYVEVKIGSQKKFQSAVQKKTLNPVWEESVTTQLPAVDEKLELSVWDKDPLMMKDFIGCVEFTADELRRISSIGEPGWYLLQKTPSGQIKLGIKVLTQDMKGCLDELSVFAGKPVNLPSISDSGATNEETVDLQILAAKDLAAMDSNGFSDPFVEVRVGSHKRYQTAVKKKTLNPVWEESVTTELPPGEQNMELNVYDKDKIGKDFIGGVSFTGNDLKRMSSLGEPGWYTLQNCQTGSIKLRVKVNTKEPLPSPTTRNDVFDAIDAEVITPDNAEVTASGLGTLPKQQKSKKKSGLSLLKRSQSENQVNKPDRFRFFKFRSSDKDPPSQYSSTNAIQQHTSSDSGRRSSAIEPRRLAKYDSDIIAPTVAMTTNAELPSSPTTTTTSSTTLTNSSNKFFNVKGQITHVRINSKAASALKGSLYCKLRIDSRSEAQRKQKFSAGRVICRTPNVNVQEGEMPLLFDFEVDKGGGIPGESLFIFDIKNTIKNTHVATRGYSLANMFDDNVTFEHWLPMENDVQFRIAMTRDRTTQALTKTARNPLNRISQSFRRPKRDSSPVRAQNRHSAPPSTVDALVKSTSPKLPLVKNSSVEKENFLDASSTATDVDTSRRSSIKDLTFNPSRSDVSDMEFSTDLNVGRLDLDLGTPVPSSPPLLSGTGRVDLSSPKQYYGLDLDANDSSDELEFQPALNGQETDLNENLPQDLEYSTSLPLKKRYEFSRPGKEGDVNEHTGAVLTNGNNEDFDLTAGKSFSLIKRHSISTDV